MENSQHETTGTQQRFEPNCSFCEEAAQTRYFATFLGGQLAFCSETCAGDYADNARQEANTLSEFSTRWRLEEAANV